MKVQKVEVDNPREFGKRSFPVFLAVLFVIGLMPLGVISHAHALGENDLLPSSYNIHTYRDAQYGTSPNGEADTDGCHFVIEATFPFALTLSDATAAAASFTGAMTSVSAGTFSNQTVSVSGKVLTLDTTTALLPGGELKIAAMTINGVTSGGTAVCWPAMDTIIPTGLAFHITEATVGTSTTPATTTIEIDHSAVLRSMNHILWTSNGGSIISGAGTAQTTAAHHHMFWSFTLKDSATSIQSNAVSTLSKLGYAVSISDDGYSITLKAATPKEGEYLGIYNYDDNFLQANGLTLSDAVSGLSAPTPSSVYDISKRSTITVADSVEYTGQTVTPSLSVADGRYGELAEGVDYAVGYSNNVALGAQATVTITGMGKYSGSVIRTFRIAKSLSTDMFNVDTSAAVYKGSACTKSIASSLAEGTDYSVAYKDNAFAGTATITLSGLGTYRGTLTYRFVIQPAPLGSGQFTVDTSSRIYTGKAFRPVVSSSLIDAVDYKTTYSANTNVGIAAVTITGVGNYSGTLLYHFRIGLGTSAFTKVKVGKGKLSLAWTKSGARTYKVYYRVAGSKKWKVKSTTKTSLTVTNLKNGKRYQVKAVSIQGSAKTSSKVKTSSKIK